MINHKRATVALCAAALGGCAGGLPMPGADSPLTSPLQPVAVISSDFCEIVGDKLSWDVHDTRRTIDGVRQLNAKFDRKCVPPAPTS